MRGSRGFADKLVRPLGNHNPALGGLLRAFQGKKTTSFKVRNLSHQRKHVLHVCMYVCTPSQDKLENDTTRTYSTHVHTSIHPNAPVWFALASANPLSSSASHLSFRSLASRRCASTPCKKLDSSSSRARGGAVDRREKSRCVKETAGTYVHT